MKNYFILLWSLIVLSCSSDDNVKRDVELQGTWVSKSVIDNNIEVRTNYRFNNDGSYSSSVTSVDLSNNVILGFRSLETGVYQTDGDLLKIKRSSFKISPSGEYVSQNELEAATPGDYTFFYSFQSDNNVLRLIPECPLNASCIDQLLFDRVAEEFIIF